MYQIWEIEIGMRVLTLSWDTARSTVSDIHVHRFRVNNWPILNPGIHGTHTGPAIKTNKDWPVMSLPYALVISWLRSSATWEHCRLLTCMAVVSLSSTINYLGMSSLMSWTLWVTGNSTNSSLWVLSTTRTDTEFECCEGLRSYLAKRDDVEFDILCGWKPLGLLRRPKFSNWEGHSRLVGNLVGMSEVYD